MSGRSGATVNLVEGCDCAGNDAEYTGQEALDRAAKLRHEWFDPREQGPKDEYTCLVCGEAWIADYPFHHWAENKRGQMYLRRVETLRSGRPLNALP